MIPSKSVKAASIIAGILLAFACNSDPEQASTGGASRRPPVRKPVPGPNGPKGENEEVCPDDICEAPPPGPVVKDVPTLASWCAAAGATKVVKETLGEQFAQICSSGAPTAFLVNTLIPQAYTGTGEPKLYAVTPPAAANKIVSAFFAVGIKMPIKAAAHFQSIAPRDANVETEKSKITAQGAKPTNNVSVTAVGSNADSTWVRGWTINSDSTAQVKVPVVGNKTVNITYTYQLDQYKLATSGYLYTSIMQRSVATVRGYQILNAVFDHLGNGYQILVAKISADENNQEAKVTEAVQGIAASLVKHLYQQSQSP